MSATALPSATACSLEPIRTPRVVRTWKNSSIRARSSPRSEASETFNARARRSSVWIEGATCPFS